MPVDYDSDEAQTVELVIAMFANAAGWQTATSAVDATGAKARIVEWDGGLDVDETEEVRNCLGNVITAAAPLLVITSTEFPAEERAQDSERRSGEFICRLYLPIDAADTAPEAGRRALNIGGAIRAQVRDQFGQSGRLMRGSISLRGPFIPDDNGSWRSALVLEFTLRWRA